jgi:hypothetical protein
MHSGWPTPLGARVPRGRIAKPDRALPEGYQYAGYCGKRAQLRYLRQSFRRVCALRDPASIAALARLHVSLFEDPDQGHATTHLAHAALLAAEETGSTWAASVNMMLDEFDKRAAGTIA